jgi:CubicO group peptidase (beta-lactamase class C family)
LLRSAILALVVLLALALASCVPVPLLTPPPRPTPAPVLATTGQVDLANVRPKALTPELLGELDDYIAASMKLARVPGAAVAVVQDGQVVYLRGFGVREMGQEEPVTPDTLMMIGSTGKTMTTMMMATLVDDGRMAWDTPAVNILPSFAVDDPALTPVITMRDLVCACTGVPRRDLELLFNAGSLTAEDVVASLRGFRFTTGLGETFQYSNQMAASGGYIAALAPHQGRCSAAIPGAGGPVSPSCLPDAALAGSRGPAGMYDAYLQQMQQRVFDPIGMSRTTFRFEEVAADLNHATPHGENVLYEYGPLPLSVERLLIPVAPAGASWSTARDMARYLMTELNRGVSPGGVRVVSAGNLGVTWQPQIAVGPDTSYGLGWFVGKYKGLRLLYHEGNTLGFTSDLALLPEADLGIVVLTNAESANAFNEAVRFRLFELAFGQPAEHDLQFKLDFKYQMKRMQNPEVTLKPGADPEQVAPYLRAFTNPALGDIVLSMVDGRLMLDAGEFAVELRPRVDEAGGAVFVAYGPPLTGVSFEFKHNEDGKPAIVLLAPPDSYTFTAR